MSALNSNRLNKDQRHQHFAIDCQKKRGNNIYLFLDFRTFKTNLRLATIHTLMTQLRKSLWCVCVVGKPNLETTHRLCVDQLLQGLRWVQMIATKH